MTGLGSLIAERNKPLAFKGVDGARTFNPGIWAYHYEKSWLC